MAIDPTARRCGRVAAARQRCFEFDWVIDLDIKAFFDSLDHELVERAVAAHTDLPWVRLYIARWLRAAAVLPDGTTQARTKGTPQGGVISPLLANLFLHYAFDLWMERNYPHLRFERYADDAIVHCGSNGQAQAVLRPSASGWGSAVWSFIPRRPESCIARTIAGVGSTSTSASTSWAIPLGRDGPRVGGGRTSPAFYRQLAARPPKRSARVSANGG
jgi:hypothetical protein